MLRVLLVTLCVGYLTAEKPVVHLDPEKMVEILPQIMQCVGETGVDFEVLSKLRSGTTTDTKDPKIPKFIHCGFQKSGLAKKNGHVDIEKIMKMFPPTADKAVIKKTMEECDKDGKDPVDTTFQFVKCYHKKSPVKVMF